MAGIRISTVDLYNQGIFNMQTRLGELAQTQNRISNGRRILTPSDDPVNSARALEVEQSQSVTKQYSRNGDSANDALGGVDTVLGSAFNLLQNARTIVVNAGNGAYTDKELKSLAIEVRNQYDELLGLSNSTDSSGQFLFSGFQGNTKPFSETSPGVVAYTGDQGQREIQIGPSRTVPISEDGSAIFQEIKNGNGTFVVSANSANAGTGTMTPGNVTNAASWAQAANSKNFRIVFDVNSTVNPAVTTYDIVDTVNNVSMLTGAAPAGAGPYTRTYSEGSAIQLKTVAPPDTNPTAFNFGAEVVIKGAPATGDTFTIAPSTNVDVFNTLHTLVRDLETASKTASGATKLTNNMTGALSNLDNAMDRILTVRASVGTRLKEVETTKGVNADIILQYDHQLSALRDLDYSKAISELSLQQVTLEAAQKSFTRVQGLTLFQYL